MRAFVIGNGSSLNLTPMERLEGEFTIGMNRLYLKELGWDPDWWVLADFSEADDWDFQYMAARSSYYFCYHYIRPFLEPERPERVEYYGNCGHGNTNLPASWHLPEPCRFGGGITAALQLAVELGKNPIYLVGTDLYTYRGPADYDINHFHPAYSRYKIRKSTGEEINPPEAYDNLNKMLISAHTIARDSAERAGTTIYNATVGGALEVYERADIWDVLSGQ